MSQRANTLRYYSILASLIHERLADECGSTPLHFAARFNDLDAAKALLDNKADIDVLDEDDRTPVHLADFLIARGARLNQRDICLWTPLHDGSAIDPG